MERHIEKRGIKINTRKTIVRMVEQINMKLEESIEQVTHLRYLGIILGCYGKPNMNQTLQKIRYSLLTKSRNASTDYNSIKFYCTISLGT